MRLDWTASALADLRRIGAYLEREARPAVSIRMLSQIRSRSTMLLEFPLAGPALGGRDVRSLRVHSTPYILLYRIGPASIDILRISHEREYWREDR